MKIEEIHLPIEICPFEPRANVHAWVAPDSLLAEQLLACCASGDCEPACRAVVDTWKPRFVTWDAKAKEFRTALPSEVQTTCEAIYCDHEKGEFADMSKAALYLVWEAAHQFEQEVERERLDDA